MAHSENRVRYLELNLAGRNSKECYITRRSHWCIPFENGKEKISACYINSLYHFVFKETIILLRAPNALFSAKQCKAILTGFIVVILRPKRFNNSKS